MTKLEDKLIASVNKPKPAQDEKAEAEKTGKPQKVSAEPAASTKKTSRAKTKAKRKPAQKQEQENLNRFPSTLHPQRIWPD